MIEESPRQILLPALPAPGPLDEIYLWSAMDRVHEALDKVFDLFDDLMSAGKFKECDALLASADVDRLKSAVAIGFLTATWAARSQLPARAELVSRLTGRLLSEKTPEEVKQLLAGLE